MAKRALGKGLSALLGDAIAPGSAPVAEATKEPMLGGRKALMLSIDSLAANPRQPRRVMDEEALGELAASIRENGVLQPVLAREVGEGFELIAGERRLRATRLAGLTEIPALICSVEEAESMKLALLENIQREDLNAVEEAEAYQAILETYGATHEELARMLGKNRSTVTNTLRLLSLDSQIQQMIETGELTMGHARALLGIDDQEARLRLARYTVQKGLSVRALEHETRRIVTLPGASRPKKKSRPVDSDGVAIREFEDRLRHHLGAPVKISRRAQKGKIEIQFFSNEELEGILERMGVSSQL